MDESEVVQLPLSPDMVEDSVFEQTISQRFLEMIARLNSEQIDRMLSYNASKNSDVSHDDLMELSVRQDHKKELK